MCKMNRLQTMHQNLPSTKIQKLHVNPTWKYTQERDLEVD
jgi:hypothetical protein